MRSVEADNTDRSNGSLRIDDLDRQIIAQLTQDARRSYAVVGAQVGLSAPAVKRRVDRLRADGVLMGFTAVVDPAALGWSVEAFVEVYCEGRVSPARIRAMVSDIPEVQSAYTVKHGERFSFGLAGGADLAGEPGASVATQLQWAF